MFTNESFLNCDVEEGKFSLVGESNTHHIDFGLSNGQPSCTCGDWSKTHYPCKHFFAVFFCTNLVGGGIHCQRHT